MQVRQMDARHNNIGTSTRGEATLSVIMAELGLFCLLLIGGACQVTERLGLHGVSVSLLPAYGFAMINFYVNASHVYKGFTSLCI